MNGHEAKTMAMLILDAYPQTALREQTASIYEKWLSDLDRTATEAAIEELIANQTTLPTVAEIRRTVIERSIDLPSAFDAWRQVSERGHEMHALVKEVAELFGGTWNIRTADEPTIVRAQFMKAYEATREQRLREANIASRRAA